MHEQSASTTDPTARLTDPTVLEEREDITTTTQTKQRESRDYCGSDIDGVAIAGITNDDGELLVLIEETEGIAILPHETVDHDEDWAETAIEGVAGLTGIEAELDDVALLRTVDHVVDGDHHCTTHRVVYRGSPVGGEIQECKTSAEAGSDGWRAEWVETLPDGVAAPEGDEREDLALFLE